MHSFNTLIHFVKTAYNAAQARRSIHSLGYTAPDRLFEMMTAESDEYVATACMTLDIVGF